VKKPSLPKKRQVDENTIDSVSDESKSSETKHRKINNSLGTYTEEEEQRFLEGINLYGRDWKNVCIIFYFTFFFIFFFFFFLKKNNYFILIY